MLSGFQCLHCVYCSTSISLICRNLSKTHLAGSTGSSLNMKAYYQRVSLQTWNQYTEARAYWVVQNELPHSHLTDASVHSHSPTPNLNKRNSVAGIRLTDDPGTRGTLRRYLCGLLRGNWAMTGTYWMDYHLPRGPSCRAKSHGTTPIPRVDRTRPPVGHLPRQATSEPVWR